MTSSKNITIGTVQTEEELVQILELQSKYHVSNYSKDDVPGDGFLTVKHDIQMLRILNAAASQVIARADSRVIGYALVMLPQFADLIPVLKPMFQMFDQLYYQGKSLNQYSYYVMGQICIDENYRGAGIFRMLYDHHRINFSNKYDFLITEVALRNKHSMQAHEKIGFSKILTYTDIGEEWNIMLWNWLK